ncbi:DUF7522 family protein [Halobacterium noricense]|uniref:DUF7522 family protein n=1 Tax=Halobacterium noricense TaxID=223182 RepID=UPI001E62EBC1|nr:hypothetical protein [Halobacterium noricense]UHH26789.1 hypothetical protein LT974_07620 [Halobacterium noricense]
MTTYDTQPQSGLDDGKAALVDALHDALGDPLRDVWVLDQRTQQPLYLRDDVAERIEDVAVEKHLDNERYGFVTRQTYNRLHYSEFRYTHRGFDTWELFRTFVTDDDAQVGVVVGLDSDGTSYDFGTLTDVVHGLADEYGAGAFAPVAPDDA